MPNGFNRESSPSGLKTVTALNRVSRWELLNSSLMNYLYTAKNDMAENITDWNCRVSLKLYPTCKLFNDKALPRKRLEVRKRFFKTAISVALIATYVA